MKGLLVAATALEISPIIKKIKKHPGWQVLVTGIGGVATTYAIMQFLAKNKTDILLQAGIGGSFSKKIKPGAVVAIDKDCYGDLGVTEGKNRKTIFDMELMPPNAQPYKKGFLYNPYKKILKKTGLPQVSAVTINKVTTNKTDISFYKQKLGAAVESMEGAAFHYVALMQKIPFVQIRSISNKVGERDKAKWHMAEAITNLNIEIERIITGFAYDAF